VTSVTFISGLAGEERWEDHAIMTGRMISAAEPSYVGLLTLMVAPGAPLYRDVQEGRFSVLPPRGGVDETLLLLEHTEVSGNCVFRSNHASNYISLKGTLPADRDAMIESLRAARGHEDLLKKDWMRML
jgi:hypothetical protein